MPSTAPMSKDAKIYVAGHRGMVGSAIVRRLQNDGYSNIITRTHGELDLTNQLAVSEFMQREKPDHIVLAAAKVGGIQANNIYRAEFLYQNLMIEANIIHSAWQAGVTNLLFLGSSCIYPRDCAQPIKEAYLLTGPLEPTNEPYAIAKIAGIKLCESYNRQYGRSHGTDFRCVMPTNLYGPGDNYHPENSHVIPALIRRFHEARLRQAPSVAIWGSGTPRREFLYVGDMAAASVHIMEIDKSTYAAHTKPTQSHINIGFGSDIDIAALAFAVAKVVGYQGDISFDSSKPDGAPRKLLESSKLKNLGWRPKVDLEKGLELAYADFCNNATNSHLQIVVKQRKQSTMEFASPWFKDATSTVAMHDNKVGAAGLQAINP